MRLTKVFTDLVSSTLERVGFPLSKPTSRSTDAKFKTSYSASDRHYWYSRSQAAKRIVDILPHFGLKEGFYLFTKKTEESDFQEMLNRRGKKSAFNDRNSLSEQVEHDFEKYKDAWITAFELARLDGKSTLFIGWNDVGKNGSKLSDEVVSNSKISYLYPFRKKDFNWSWGTGFPPKPEYGSCYLIEDGSEVHPSRFIPILNRDITGSYSDGRSVLDVVGDILVVHKHADWSIGQRLWRSAVGMLFLYAPKGINAKKRSEVEDRFTRLDAMTVSTIPKGWDISVRGLGSRAGGIEGTYDRVIEQYSIATGIPLSIHTGKQTAYSTKNVDREDFADVVAAWQDSFASKFIKEFIKLGQRYGYYEMGDYSIVWNEIFKQSPVEIEKEKFTLEVLSALQKDVKGKSWEEVVPVIKDAWRLLKK